ncbi:hypothetical protein NPIL_455761 [Nephila pilipes]|uniref:Uncharacterized protein n=1 Tax=Nephila pilipes TaxID=299642 RepID=A0A8X6THD0_NEPPI|nr:hypothetical protein NPIL_455761 [Nephila pilipes]
MAAFASKGKRQAGAVRGSFASLSRMLRGPMFCRFKSVLAGMRFKGSAWQRPRQRFKQKVCFLQVQVRQDKYFIEVRPLHFESYSSASVSVGPSSITSPVSGGVASSAITALWMISLNT